MLIKILRKLLFSCGVYHKAEIEISIKGFNTLAEHYYKVRNEIKVGDIISAHGADNSGSFYIKIVKKANESIK